MGAASHPPSLSHPYHLNTHSCKAWGSSDLFGSEFTFLDKTYPTQDEASNGGVTEPCRGNDTSLAPSPISDGGAEVQVPKEPGLHPGLQTPGVLTCYFSFPSPCPSSGDVTQQRLSSMCSGGGERSCNLREKVLYCLYICPVLTPFDLGNNFMSLLSREPSQIACNNFVVPRERMTPGVIHLSHHI